MIKNFSIYTASTLINSAIPFVLLPLLTHYLEPAEYGIIALIQVAITFATILISLNVHGAVNVTYFKIDKNLFPHYVTSVAYIVATAFILVFVLVAVFNGALAKVIPVNPMWLLLLPLVALFQTIYNLLLSIYQAREQPIQYAKLLISNTIINVSLTIFLVMFMEMGWEGRYLGILIAVFLSALAATIYLYRASLIALPESSEHVKDILAFGLPLMPHAIGGILLMMSDRFFISTMVSQEALGLYAVAFQVASIVLLVATALNKAWTPYLFKNLSVITEQGKTDLVRKSYILFVVMVAMVVAVIIFNPLIFQLFLAEKYWEAQTYVFWLCVGFGFNGLYFIVVNYISYAKKTKLLGGLTFTVSLIAILNTYILIDLCGVDGAAYAIAINWFIFFVSAWILSNRIYPMPWFKALYVSRC